ncbi:DUF4357 domain-containing protein [Desulfurivibrio sp. D14AmB]
MTSGTRAGKGTEHPSAAAAVVNGRPANGTIAWKLQATGKPTRNGKPKS